MSWRLGERVLASAGLHGIAGRTQRRDDPVKRRAEPSFGLLDGEQVHVLCRPVDQPMLTDRARAGQGEAGLVAGGLQGQARDAPLLLLVTAQTATRSRGNRPSHSSRTRGSMFSIGHVSISRSRFIKRPCSLAVPSASNAW